ncbi:hypothetical protein DH2020_043147 [Rehmannia glutinosa]|uniref:Remorin C-terminal domain-containing protein n=1 Tax=Rehmannia glutinosa TaxID=99300 RepID=A0ABR0UKY6_REHGL
MMRRSYDSDDVVFATALAASAHAIHSQLEAAKFQVQHTKASNTRKLEPYRAPQGGPIRKPSTKETTTRSSSFVRPTVSLAEEQRQKQTSIWGLRSSDAKADAWEKAQIAKIRKRYEKMHSQIQAWENEKKLREKHQMERKKDELEQRKSRNLKHYYSKIARIDHIAGGARAQVDEKRKHEESIVKQKARKMRSTGKTPVTCFCF